MPPFSLYHSMQYNIGYWNAFNAVLRRLLWDYTWLSAHTRVWPHVLAGPSFSIKSCYTHQTCPKFFVCSIGRYNIPKSFYTVRFGNCDKMCRYVNMPQPREDWPICTVLTICLSTTGVATSYLIIIGGLMPRVVLSFDANPPHWLLDRHLWIVISMAVLSPLCYLRQLHSLRFTSYIAVVAAFDLVVVVVYKFFDRSGLEPGGPTHLFTFSPRSISSLPVYIFAFTCAQNLFSCYNELRENTKSRMNIVTGVSIG